MFTLRSNRCSTDIVGAWGVLCDLGVYVTGSLSIFESCRPSFAIASVPDRVHLLASMFQARKLEFVRTLVGARNEALSRKA